MTNREFAFNYAGKEFMYYGTRVALVGYESESSYTVIISPLEIRTVGYFWKGLGSGDVITYRGKGKVYQYAQINELVPVPEEKPRTPGDCIAYYEGRRGMNYSVINGSVSAVYKRQGGALKLVSWGEGINDVTAKV